MNATTQPSVNGDCEIRSLDVAKIRLDCGTQSREAIDSDLVDEYADLLREGKQFKDPIEVFLVGSEHVAVDGFHRILAYLKVDVERAPAKVMHGTLREAVLYSLSTNSSHGKRRSPGDLRKVVKTILADPEWAQKSSREIGRLTNISHSHVHRIRNFLEAAGTKVFANEERSIKVMHMGRVCTRQGRVGRQATHRAKGDTFPITCPSCGKRFQAKPDTRDRPPVKGG